MTAPWQRRPPICWRWRVPPLFGGRRQGQVHPPPDAGVFCGGGAAAAAGEVKICPPSGACRQRGRDAAHRTGRMGRPARPRRPADGRRPRSWRLASTRQFMRQCSRSTWHWPPALCWRAGRRRTLPASSAARRSCWQGWAAPRCMCAAGLRPGCCCKIGRPTLPSRDGQQRQENPAADGRDHRRESKNRQRQRR